MDLQLCEGETPDAIEEYADRVAERKLDGVRAYTEDGHLFTRSGNDITASFPEIDPPEHHILDGEIITGDFRFETVLRRVQTEDRFKVELLSEKYPAVLVVFDVLQVNGGDVTDKPLLERKEMIGPSIPTDSGMVEITMHDDPAVLWEQVEAEGWEGLILKDPKSLYRGKRSEDWLKVKNWQEATFPITGHEHTDNDGFVIYVDIQNGEPQKVAVNGQDDQADVLNGADQAEVQYLERSDAGKLRKPSFKGVA